MGNKKNKDVETLLAWAFAILMIVIIAIALGLYVQANPPSPPQYLGTPIDNANIVGFNNLIDQSYNSCILTFKSMTGKEFHGNVSVFYSSQMLRYSYNYSFNISKLCTVKTTYNYATQMINNLTYIDNYAALSERLGSHENFYNGNVSYDGFVYASNSQPQSGMGLGSPIGVDKHSGRIALFNNSLNAFTGLHTNCTIYNITATDQNGTVEKQINMTWGLALLNYMDNQTSTTTGTYKGTITGTMPGGWLGFPSYVSLNENGNVNLHTVSDYSFQQLTKGICVSRNG